MNVVKRRVAAGVLWVVLLGVHFAFQLGINRSTRIAGFGASSLLLYVVVTLGVHAECRVGESRG